MSNLPHKPSAQFENRTTHPSIYPSTLIHLLRKSGQQSRQRDGRFYNRMCQLANEEHMFAFLSGYRQCLLMASSSVNACATMNCLWRFALVGHLDPPNVCLNNCRTNYVRPAQWMDLKYKNFHYTRLLTLVV